MPMDGFEYRGSEGILFGGGFLDRLAGGPFASAQQADLSDHKRVSAVTSDIKRRHNGPSQSVHSGGFGSWCTDG
jgi:hypothetical protein